MIKIENCNYKKYGKCLSLTNGKTKVMITVDVGPRIIYLGGVDGENIMFEDLDDKVSEGGEFFDKHYKKGERWHIYGGHRLWKSPEDWASYSADNYPVDVELVEGGAIFTTATELTTTSLQKSIKVTMDCEGEITIVHKFTNKGKVATKVAIWALTVMNKGGRAYLPLSNENTGLLPNRNMVLWSYTDVADPRLTIKNDGYVIRQDPNYDKNFKLGYFNPYGVAYYQIGGKLFKKSYDVVACGNYPDSYSNTECYTSKHILEVETLGELTNLEAGKSMTHTERWHLFDKNSPEYKEIDAKF